MRVNYAIVDSWTTKVEPKDCHSTRYISSSTTKAVKEAFPGCAVSVWDGGAWNEVEDYTEALVVEGASLKAVQPAPAGKARC